MRAINVFLASERKETQFKVIEITGKIRGYYVPSEWFVLQQKQQALKALRKLDQGNAWISDAWEEKGQIYTGARKRINLNHPDSI
jgi:hypothetical protein